MTRYTLFHQQKFNLPIKFSQTDKLKAKKKKKKNRD